MRKGGRKVYHISRKAMALILVFLMTVGVLPGLFAVGGSTAYAAGTDIYVSAGGADNGDGSQGNPYKTIQAGIDAVPDDSTVNGTVVHVAADIYKEHLNIGKNVTLLGEGENSTIIDGNQSGRVIEIAAGCEVKITGFTITNGKAPDGGDGDLYFAGGAGGAGGGICNSGTVTITSCTITGNSAGDGGHGGRVGSGGDGGAGGGICNSGTVTITSCTITGNSAGNGGHGGRGVRGGYGGDGGDGGAGGGICNSGTVTITSCTITGNSAGNGGHGGDGGDECHGGAGGAGGAGGGICNSGTSGTVTITGCTITGNSAGASGADGAGGDAFVGGIAYNGGDGGAGGAGGGICNSGTVTITGCTITGNSAGTGGTGGTGGDGDYGGYGGDGGAGGAGGGIYSKNGSVDATNNWWGTIYDPTSISIVNGSVIVDPWLLEKPSAAAPVTITTDNLPAGIVGEVYSFSLQISGGNAPYTWQISGLPDGLSMDTAAGEITGTSAVKGSYSVSVTVTDTDGSTDSKTYTLVLDESCGNGKYLVIPVTDDTNYTTSFTNDDIPMMTVKSGISGLKYFSVNICPVTGHSGDETAVFVHMRGELQVGFSAVRADFDEMHSAQAAFNIQEGDIIKVFLFDNLNNNNDSNPVLL